MANPATSASILRAQVLSKSVVHGIHDAEKTIASNKEQRQKEAALEKERLQDIARTRVRRNEEIIKEDEQRIFGTDAAIKKAMACIRGAITARYSHFAAGQVTDRRLILRIERTSHLRTAGRAVAEGERPPTVATFDSVQGMLERERRFLNAARERLQELEQMGKVVIQELEAVRGYLSQDAAKRRFAVEQDRAYIISFGSVTAGGPLAPPPEIDEEGVVRARETQQHVSGLEDRVLQVHSISANDIKKFKNEYKQVHFQLEELLAKSTYSLDDLGKRLKGQAKEVDTTTRMAERSLGEIKKKNLTKGDEVGASKVAALETLVDDLRVTRSALQEDIRSKSFLLDIDERCRKVTTTGEKLFCDSDSRKRAMRKAGSAPCLRSTGQFAVNH